MLPKFSRSVFRTRSPSLASGLLHLHFTSIRTIFMIGAFQAIELKKAKYAQSMAELDAARNREKEVNDAKVSRPSESERRRFDISLYI